MAESSFHSIWMFLEAILHSFQIPLRMFLDVCCVSWFISIYVLKDGSARLCEPQHSYEPEKVKWSGSKVIYSVCLKVYACRLIKSKPCDHMPWQCNHQCCYRTVLSCDCVLKSMFLATFFHMACALLIVGFCKRFARHRLRLVLDWANLLIYCKCFKIWDLAFSVSQTVKYTS